MTDRKALLDQNETPDDVATLYSWANLHGAKYRDFSAARAQTREKTRLRVQKAMEDEQERTRLLDEVEPTQPLRLVAEAAESEEGTRRERVARELAAQEQAARALAIQKQAVQEQAVRQEAARFAAQQSAQIAAEQAARLAAQQSAERAAHQAAQLAAQQSAQQAAQFAAQQSAERATYQARMVEETRTAQFTAEQARAAQQAAEQAAEQELAARRAAQLAVDQARADQARMDQARMDQARIDQEVRAMHQAAEQAKATERALEEAKAAQQAAQQIRAAQQAAWHQPYPEPHPASMLSEPAQALPQSPAPSSFFAPPSFSMSPAVSPAAAPAYRSTPPQPVFQAVASQPSYGSAPPVREERPQPPRPLWGSMDLQDAAPRPAWLSPERVEPAAAVPAAAPLAPPLVPEDTLQGSRDRLTSRWFALKGVFQGGSEPADPAPAPMPSRAPVLSIFSLAGGVGKTSLTASLGRALSSRGERVLLIDTAPYGLLPFYFGACDQRPGQLRTFMPPGASGDAPIQMLSIDSESLGPEAQPQDPLGVEIARHGAGMSRVIVDLATASGSITRRVLRMAPLVLVPLMPDMNSVVSVSAIDAFFQRMAGFGASHSLPFYVLNQFDASLPLHLDVREVLREQLGERLLPFALRRAPAVSEALAEGMTVMDYAPNSTVAEDFGNLAGWVKGQSAPATTGFRGVRWSER